MVWAGIHASTALDALVLIDQALSVDDVDRIFRTHLSTLMGQAPLAAVRYDDLLLWAGIACELDDVDQRIIIILFCDRTFFNAIRQCGLFLHCTQRKSDSQTQTLSDDRTLQEDAVAIACLVSWQDLVRKLLDLLCVIAAFIGESCNLSKDLSANICY